LKRLEALPLGGNRGIVYWTTGCVCFGDLGKLGDDAPELGFKALDSLDGF